MILSKHIEDTISKETFELAKQKGFIPDERVDSMVIVKSGGMLSTDGPQGTGEEKMPTQSILQKWLRETHNININIGFYLNVKKWDTDVYNMDLSGKQYAVKFPIGRERFKKDSYEEALEVGLLEALNTIKN